MDVITYIQNLWRYYKVKFGTCRKREELRHRTRRGNSTDCWIGLIIFVIKMCTWCVEMYKLLVCLVRQSTTLVYKSSEFEQRHRKGVQEPSRSPRMWGGRRGGVWEMPALGFSVRCVISKFSQEALVGKVSPAVFTAPPPPSDSRGDRDMVQST